MAIDRAVIDPTLPQEQLDIMSTVYPVPRDYPSEITGYAQPWIASPGDDVDIKVSCTEPQYKYRLVRYVQGYESQNGPAKVVEELPQVPSGFATGRFQLAHPGSYAEISGLSSDGSDEGIEVTFHCQPWLVNCDHVQALVSTLNEAKCSGFAIVLDKNGMLQVWVGTGGCVEVLVTNLALERRRWAKIDILLAGCKAEVSVKSLAEGTEPAGESISTSFHLREGFQMDHNSQWLLAASRLKIPSDVIGQDFPCNYFNGRLDSVIIQAVGCNARLLAHYDFSLGISSDLISDISGNQRHGILVNAPTRGVKGFDWDGTETDWTKAKYGYGAIHFHEDDLDDAGWVTDFTLTIPQDARSGVYGIEIESTTSDVRDTIPLFVRPIPRTTAKLGAKVVLVASTFTYLAYANEHMFDPNSPARAEVPDEFGSFEFWKDEDFYKQERRKDLGLSCYDVHRDHSGVVFSSSKRPLLNHRPGYINWTGHRPRELSAELIMVGFLDRLGIPCDVITDHDLHIRGRAALQGYAVAVTGCHPEYPSLESHTAYEDFVKSGGNLMYLGGNGFYWASAFDSKQPHRLEVRRGGQGVRTSCQEPGERHHSTDGHIGGLWRDRGKAANYLLGVGCCGEGAGPGVPYRMTPGLSQNYPEVAAWVFHGFKIDDPQGLFFGRNALGGFGGGASADEIDRMDFRYGSPRNIVVLASSTGHSDRFGLFPEDAGFPMMKTLGTQTDMIRSDMTYYNTSGGGAVFSVGSISWYCALGWNDYKNDVACITSNVLREFLGRSISGPNSRLRSTL